MPEYYVHSVGSNFIVVSSADDGQILRLAKDQNEDIAKLIAKRQRIGQLLTARLRKDGLVANEDDEETVIIKR